MNAVAKVDGQAVPVLGKQLFTNPFADVDVAEVSVAGESIASKIAVRVKADDGTWGKAPAILSSDYKVIQNGIARDVASDIMSRSGQSWKELKTLWDGRKYTAFHITQAPVADVSGLGHPIHVGLMVRNAYDGSGVFALEVYACNMHCTNQYHDRNRFGFFAVRHDNAREFDVQDALANLSSGVQNVIAVAPKISQLRGTDLSVKMLTDARVKTQVPKSMWGDVLLQLAKEEATAFGLYQALTNVASHEVGGFSQIAVGESISKFLLPA